MEFSMSGTSTVIRYLPVPSAYKRKTLFVRAIARRAFSNDFGAPSLASYSPKLFLWDRSFREHLVAAYL